MRMKKMFSIFLILVFTVACSTNIHTIGNGPATGTEEKARQWYILWGLVPLNSVDSNQMAGGSKNYQIKTSATFGDQFIGLFTGAVTISCRTVKVTR